MAYDMDICVYSVDDFSWWPVIIRPFSIIQFINNILIVGYSNGLISVEI